MNPEFEPNIYLKNENKEEDLEKDAEVKHEFEENICQELREEANKEAREMLESEDDITLLEKIKKKGKNGCSCWSCRFVFGCYGL